MNIFVLDNDPEIAAKYHTDKHVVKMILESAQMMSTVVRYSGIDFGYKSTHLNHPCTIWARASLSNWLWLGSLAYYLNLEFINRFGKTANHKSYDLIASLPWPLIQDIGLTSFAQAMPDQYKNTDPVVAYRQYYINEKRHLFQWTNVSCPPYQSWMN